MKIPTLAATLVGAGALMALATGFVAQQGAGAHRMHAGMAQAATAPVQAAGAASAAPVRTIRIALAADGALVPGVYRFHKNDSAVFRITVPYDGMLAVHGYTADVPLSSARELTVPLTFAHTGRFPMHVHAHGGQHIEIATLEILPD